jgi:polysaccharide export outer membrane protein
MRLPLTGLLALCLLAACTDGSVNFPTAVKPQEKVAAETHVTIVRITQDNIASFAKPHGGPEATKLAPAEAGEYKIGPGDVLSIYVFDHPELAVPSAEAGAGFLVKSDGSLAYPFLNTVPAAGKTVEDLRMEMTQGLTKYFPAPQVDIRVLSFNSQQVVVIGEVNHPGTLALDTKPMTLLDAINAAGGMDADADARAVTVRRGGKVYAVDLAAFMTGDLVHNNPTLAAGDLVAVPRLKVMEAYVLGEINAAPVDLSKDTITLTQAITRQGGLSQNRADARGVFVFRATGAAMTVYQLDVSSPTGLLLGTQFELDVRDVVYITTSPLQRWNDTISRLLPTVGAYSTAQSIAK